MTANTDIVLDEGIARELWRDGLGFLLHWAVAMVVLRLFCEKLHGMSEVFEELPVRLSTFNLAAIRFVHFFGVNYAGLALLAGLGAVVAVLLWKAPLSEKQKLVLRLAPIALYLSLGMAIVGIYLPIFAI